MNRCFFSIITLLLFIATVSLQAQIPRTLSYQGVLTDSSGNPKPDGTYNLVFRMYDVEEGGTALWSESETVTTKRGLFSSILGDGTAFPSSMNFDEQYWLSIEVDAPPELSPRIPLTAVGYSMHSISADTAYVTITSVSDTLWKRSGDNIYRATGNVGIGTSNPSDKLHLIGQVRWQNPTGNVVGVLSYDTAADLLGIGSSIEGNESAALSLWAGGLERVRLDQSGNVGIGTTSPTAKLTLGSLSHSHAFSNGAIFFNGCNDYFDYRCGMIFRGSGIYWATRFTATDSMETTGEILGIYGAENTPGDAANGIGSLVTFRNDGRVGIGTTAPAYILDVNGDLNLSAGSVYRVGGVEQTGSSKWTAGSGDNIYRLNGNVGIGTTVPLKKLQVSGSILSTDTLFTKILAIDDQIIKQHTNYLNEGRTVSLLQTAESNQRSWLVIAPNGTSSLSDVDISTTSDLVTNTSRLHLGYDGATNFYVIGTLKSGNKPQRPLVFDATGITTWNWKQLALATNGNVGIGTTTPGYKLDVDGDLNLSAGSVYRIGGVEQTGSSKWTAGSGDNIYRMSGNVGIGTNDPTQPLSIYIPSGYSGLKIESGSSQGGEIYLKSPVGTWEIYHVTDNSLRFFNGSDLVTFSSNGRVGIGTNSPSEMLELKDGGTALANAWHIRSSRRWKTNIEPLQNSLEKVEKLQGVSFDWKESGKSDIGLIAEDVGKIVPEVVTFEENGIDAKSIDYAKLVGVLIEAIKDQQKQINELKAAMNSLSLNTTE